MIITLCVIELDTSPYNVWGIDQPSQYIRTALLDSGIGWHSLLCFILLLISIRIYFDSNFIIFEFDLIQSIIEA